MRLSPRSPKVLLTAICLLAIGCSDQLLTPEKPDFSRGDIRASLADEWVEEIFIDRGPDASHVGPDPTPTRNPAVSA